MNKNKTVRPWGNYSIIDSESDYKVKKITVNPGQRLSYQFHNKRSESWTIIKGSGIVIINDKKLHLNYGDSIQIQVKSKHRILNNTDNLLVFIEVQTGEYFGEDDIVRIKDDYNRV